MALHGTIRLSCLSLFDIAILPQFRKDVLHNSRLVRGGRSTEDVEFDVKPVIDTLVDSMVFGAQFFWRCAFFEGLGFCRCSIFILQYQILGLVSFSKSNMKR